MKTAAEWNDIFGEIWSDWKRCMIKFPARVIGHNEADRVWCADGSVWRIKEKRGGKWTRRRVKR